MKRFFLVVLVLVTVMLCSCATTPRTIEETTKTIPLPSDTKIIPPFPELPREIAAFSGKWIGKWEGYFKSILIVEKITKKEAEVIYATESDPRWKVEAKYQRFVAKVIPATPDINPQIEFDSGPVTFNFEMKKDLNTLEGIRTYRRGGNYRSLGTMKRVNESSKE